MKLKQKVIIDKKEYIIGELTVGLYYLFLVDFPQFLEAVFLEYNNEFPHMSEEQIKVFFTSYFDIKEESKNNKVIDKEENAEMLLINIGKFMKFFSSSYDEIINMPFRVFIYMFENIEIITGDKVFVYSKNKDKNDRKRLKDLLNNT